MLDVVQDAGVALMIGLNRRFDPNFAAVQQRLRAGAVGDVELVTILSRDPAPPPISYIERSGGLFRDMMIHDFDMARFLLGEEPVEVQALGSNLVDPAIGRAPSPTGLDGLRAQRLAAAATQSARSGKPVAIAVED